MATDHFIGDPRSNYELMGAGDLYISDDPEIFSRQQRATRLAGKFQAAFLEDTEAAQGVLRDLLGAVGEGSHVRAPIYVDYGSNLTIGECTFINYSLTALDVVSSSVGSHCQVGPNAQLLTATHPVAAQPAGTSWSRRNQPSWATMCGSVVE